MRFNKPFLGTPLNLAHRQLRGLVWWSVFQEGAGGRIRNLVDLTGDSDGAFSGIAIPPTVNSGWNPGKFGKTVMVDGVDDFIDIGAVPVILQNLPANGMTVTGWLFDHRTAINELGTLIGNLDVASASGWSIRTQALAGDGTRKLVWQAVFSGDDMSYTTNVGTIPNNDWVHVAIVIHSDHTATIYIDGVPVSLAGATPGTGNYIDDSGTDLVLGSLWWGGAYIQGFDGLFDDVRVYNRELLQPEIQDVVHDQFAAFADPLDIALLAQLAGVTFAAHYYRTLMQGDRL